MPALPDVLAPTLLIVGSLDTEVLQLNQLAKQAMQTKCDILTIDGATHLFEEPVYLKSQVPCKRRRLLQNNGL
jgi:alpha/beta superfamily hydrolase